MTRAADAKVVEYRELVAKEVAARRRIFAKVMELQGNIRVHVRVRPTDGQLAAVAAARSVPAPATTGMAAAAGASALGTPLSSRRHASGYLAPLSPSSAGGSPGSPVHAAAAAAATFAAAALPPASGVAVEAGEGGRLTVRVPTGVSAGDWATAPLAGGSLAASGGQGNHRRTVYEYEFDEVHGPGANQEAVFEYIRPMVDAALDGYNMTVFAYGQTGSGKTHSMEGTARHPGITVRAVRHLFAATAARSAARALETGETAAGGDYTVSVAIMEVYNERVRDLLAAVTAADVVAGGGEEAPLDASAVSMVYGSARAVAAIGVGTAQEKWARRLREFEAASGQPAGSNLVLREAAGGVEVAGLVRLPVASVAEALEAIRVGAITRVVGAHDLNDTSSRSHLIIQLAVRGPAPSYLAPHGASVTSVINLVDLAGSERVLRTGAEGERLKEAQAINSSLSALGNVISALRKGAAHVPFRDSKLTFLLKDAMVGSARVLMLCCISAEESDVPESVCSLTFAQRCRATALGAAVRNVLPSPSSAIMPTARIFDGGGGGGGGGGGAARPASAVARTTAAVGAYMAPGASFTSSGSSIGTSELGDDDFITTAALGRTRATSAAPTRTPSSSSLHRTASGGSHLAFGTSTRATTPRTRRW